MIREVQLTRGLVALVDSADFERVTAYNWSAFFNGGKRPYAARQERRGGKRQYVSLHRFILAAPVGAVVDHIDGNTLNNTRANLRICTQSENMRNQRRTGVKGVCKMPNSSRWYARIFIDGKRKHLGCFATQAEAAQAYDAAAIAAFGEYARPNGAA